MCVFVENPRSRVGESSGQIKIRRNMAEGQDDAKKITLTVKTPKEKRTIEVDEDAEVKDVSFLRGQQVVPGQFLTCSGRFGVFYFLRRSGDVLMTACVLPLNLAIAGHFDSSWAPHMQWSEMCTATSSEPSFQPQFMF